MTKQGVCSYSAYRGHNLDSASYLYNPFTGVSHVHGTGTLSLNILAVLLRTGNFYASRTLQLLWLITCHTSSLLLSVIKLNCKSLRGVSVLLALWLLVMAQMQLIRSGDVKENPVPQKKQGTNLFQGWSRNSNICMSACLQKCRLYA